MANILGEHLEGASVADFPDIVTALSMEASTFADGQAHANKHRASQQINSTSLEVDMMSALEHPTPLSLFGKAVGRALVVDPEDGFGHRLKTFTAFSGKQSAFCQVTQKQVALFISTI